MPSAGGVHVIIKEGKLALRWTRLSCHAFRHNAVRLQLFALAYNLANFLRSLALPREVEQWSLTTLREKLVKIGARIVRHGRYVVFQLAEVAVPRALFAEILRRIDRTAATAATAPGMSIGSNDRWQPDRRGTAIIDGERPNAARNCGARLTTQACAASGHGSNPRTLATCGATTHDRASKPDIWGIPAKYVFSSEE